MRFFYFILLTAILFPACSSNKYSTQVQAKEKSAHAFKVIGYYYYVPSGPAAADLDLEGLMPINSSFAIPATEGYGPEPIKHSYNLQKLVEIGHKRGIPQPTLYPGIG